MHKSFIAIVLMLLSSLAIAIMSALGKVASPLIDTAVVVFFQNFISLIIVSPWALLASSGGIKTQYTRWHILRAITGAGAWYAMFLAMQYTSLSNAVLLINSAALWIPVISWLALKQVVSPKIWLGVLIGFVGVALVLHPSKGMLNYGDLLALTSGILFAIALLTVAYLNKNNEPPARILFYYFLFSSIMFLPLAVDKWQAITLVESGYLLGIGVMLMLSQWLVILAYRLDLPVKLSPFIYATIVFTCLIDWYFWQQIPTLLVFVGMLMIVGGGIITVKAKASSS